MMIFGSNGQFKGHMSVKGDVVYILKADGTEYEFPLEPDVGDKVEALFDNDAYLIKNEG